MGVSNALDVKTIAEYSDSKIFVWLKYLYIW